MKNKFLLLSLAVVMVFSVTVAGFPAVSQAAALTQTQINAIMTLLQAFGASQDVIDNVQTSLNGGTPNSGSGSNTGGTTAWCYTFNNNLTVGSSNEDVLGLHKALASEGIQDGYEGLGGTPTIIFNENMASAVVAFQEKYASEVLTPAGLSHGTGFVGQSTRAKLNQLYGCGNTQTYQPSITISDQSGNQGITVGVGGSFTISGIPQNIQGLSYGNGQGQYTRAFFFDPIFNNSCTNSDASSGVWAITCTAKTAGVGSIHVEIYKGGQTYKSNTVTVTVTNQPTCNSGQTWNGSSCVTNVTSTNRPPVISGITAPTTLAVNQTGTWTVNASDPENGSLSYSVNWGDIGYAQQIGSGTPASGVFTQTSSFTHSYSSAGTYTAAFTVKDSAGQTAQSSATVRVTGVSTCSTGYVLSNGQCVPGSGGSTQPTVIAGPTVNPANGHSYYLLSETDYNSAEAKAVALGGHLVTINDSAENAWVTSQFSRYGDQARNLWIGLNDRTNEGTWAWTNGSVASYRNWAYGEPNSGMGIYSQEDAVHIWSPDAGYGVGTWNDAQEGLTYMSVVEVGADTGSSTTQPSITVLSPNGGENYVVSNTDPNAIISVNLSLVNNPQGLVISLVDVYNSDVVASMSTDNRDNRSSIQFYVNQQKTVSVINSGQYKIKACDYANHCDYSDSYFTITAPTQIPSITVKRPNGGESYVAGQTIPTVSWTASNLPSATTIDSLTFSLISSVNGTVYPLTVEKDSRFTIGFNGSYFNDGSSFVSNMAIPSAIPAGQYRLKISCASCGVSDESDSYFVIQAPTTKPSISVVAPSAGQNVVAGQSVTIRWSSHEILPTEKITILFSNYDNTTLGYFAPDTAGVANTGTYTWAVPTNITPGRYHVQVSCAECYKRTGVTTYAWGDVFNIVSQATPVPVVPNIVLSASPTTGADVIPKPYKLTWAVTGATSCSLTTSAEKGTDDFDTWSGYAGPVQTSGSINASVVDSVTVKLTCTGPGGTSSTSVNMSATGSTPNAASLLEALKLINPALYR